MKFIEQRRERVLGGSLREVRAWLRIERRFLLMESKGHISNEVAQREGGGDGGKKNVPSGLMVPAAR
jgi:hypothetical protein